jgi:peptide/nickel transport system substrate-binding protein
MMKRLAFLTLSLVLVWLAACQQAPSPTSVAVAPTTETETETETATTDSTDTSSTTNAENGEVEPTEAAAEPTVPPEPTATALPTAVPSPTPTPAKELIVCMSRQPSSLYLHSDYSPQATAVRHALYDSLYTSEGFVYQPRALAELPTVQIVPTQVGRGATVRNSRGNLISLRTGDTVLNAEGVEETFDGQPITMNQMVVDATFKPLVWSDGTAVSSADSLFSYQLAADRHTPSNRTLIEVTQLYTTTGDLSVQWVGIPGHFTSDYHQYIWQPLPSHQLGDVSPRDMLEDPRINRRPLSYGPFVVADWVRDEKIVLEPNPYYYRAAEGLPYLERIIIRFVPDEAARIAGVLDGSCDLVTSDSLPGAETAGLADLLSNDQLAVSLASGRVLEHIAFGINQFSFDNQPLRPDWFGNPQVRQAIAHCTDRDSILQLATLGISELTSAYELPSHPLYPGEAAAYPYDPALGNSLLDEVGFLDNNGDGVREFVETTTPFSVTLQTTDNSPLRLTAVETFAQNMADCGINVSISTMAPTRFYSPETDGVIFRREFDMAAFPWLLELVPACQLYTSNNMPGPDFRGFVGWQASNVTGFRNQAFNTACAAAQNALYGTPEYEAAHQEALQIFSEQLPIVPLFARVKVALANTAVQNLRLDTAEDSDWWTVAEWDIAP